MRRIQFNLSDLVCYMLIAGAFPVVLAPRTNYPAIVFVMGAFFEFPAAVWGSELCRAWKLKNFMACLGVHVYAFVSVLCAASFPVCCIVLAIHGWVPMKEVEGEFATWLVTLAVTGAGSALILFTDAKRRRQPK